MVDKEHIGAMVVRELDQWVNGFMFGTMVGIILTVLGYWAIVGPLGLNK